MPNQFSLLARNVGRVGEYHVELSARRKPQRISTFNLNWQPTNHGVESSGQCRSNRDIDGRDMARAGADRGDS
jgi:hypothetical protein